MNREVNPGSACSVVTLGAEGRPGFRQVLFEDPDGNGWAIQEIRASSAPARPGSP